MKNFGVISITAMLLAAGQATHGIEPEPDGLERAPRVPGSAAASQIQKNDPVAIAKLIDDINAAIRTDRHRMLSIIVINTDVAASQLEREKAETGMTFGDVYVAHSLSLATRKPFKAIVAMHKSGKSWPDIAKSHGVTLKGSSELIKEMQKQQ